MGHHSFRSILDQRLRCTNFILTDWFTVCLLGVTTAPNIPARTQIPKFTVIVLDELFSDYGELKSFGMRVPRGSCKGYKLGDEFNGDYVT